MDWISSLFSGFDSKSAGEMFSWIKPAVDTLSAVGSIVTGYQQYKGGKKAAAQQQAGAQVQEQAAQTQVKGAEQQEQAAVTQEQAKPQFDAGAAQQDIAAIEQEKAAAYQQRAAQIQEEGAALQREASEKQKVAAQERLLIDRANVTREETETAEKLRRESSLYQQEEAMGRAQAAASGFKYGEDESGSTIARSLSVQRSENQRQLDYEKAAGVSRADILRRGGDVTLATNLAQALQMEAGARATAAGAEGTRASAAGTLAQAAGTRASAAGLRAQGIGAQATAQATRAAATGTRAAAQGTQAQAAGSRAQASLTATQGKVGLVSAIPAALTSAGKVYDWWKQPAKTVAAPKQQVMSNSFWSSNDPYNYMMGNN